MSRLYNSSDDDRVLSGEREPALPIDLNEYRERARAVVKAEIEKVLYGPHCPNCNSTRIREHTHPSARGSTWRFMRCDDCENVWDAGVEV